MIRASDRWGDKMRSCDRHGGDLLIDATDQVRGCASREHCMSFTPRGPNVFGEIARTAAAMLPPKGGVDPNISTSRPRRLHTPPRRSGVAVSLAFRAQSQASQGRTRYGCRIVTKGRCGDDGHRHRGKGVYEPPLERRAIWNRLLDSGPHTSRATCCENVAGPNATRIWRWVTILRSVSFGSYDSSFATSSS